MGRRESHAPARSNRASPTARAGSAETELKVGARAANAPSQYGNECQTRLPAQRDTAKTLFALQLDLREVGRAAAQTATLARGGRWLANRRWRTALPCGPVRRDLPSPKTPPSRCHRIISAA